MMKYFIEDYGSATCKYQKIKHQHLFTYTHAIT